MAALSDLQQWRDALVEARMQGVRRVRDSDGSEVEYRSDREMASAIAAAERAIAEATTGRPVLSIRFTTTKGI